VLTGHASGDDPAETGLVASLARPGGNLTGFSFLVVELHAKRLELISELVPTAKVVALLVNPHSPQTERVVTSPDMTKRRGKRPDPSMTEGRGRNLGYATCASALPREADQQMGDGLVTELE